MADSRKNDVKQHGNGDSSQKYTSVFNEAVTAFVKTTPGQDSLPARVAKALLAKVNGIISKPHQHEIELNEELLVAVGVFHKSVDKYTEMDGKSGLLKLATVLSEQLTLLRANIDLSAFAKVVQPEKGDPFLASYHDSRAIRNAVARLCEEKAVEIMGIHKNDPDMQKLLVALHAVAIDQSIDQRYALNDPMMRCVYQAESAVKAKPAVLAEVVKIKNTLFEILNTIDSELFAKKAVAPQAASPSTVPAVACSAEVRKPK